MIQFKHKHAYLYEFEIQKHKSVSCGWEKCDYVLLTNHDGHSSKENRQLLETMLRTVYGHMPKGVKFIRDKKND